MIGRKIYSRFKRLMHSSKFKGTFAILIAAALKTIVEQNLGWTSYNSQHSQVQIHTKQRKTLHTTIWIPGLKITIKD